MRTEAKVIRIYCIVNDILKSIGPTDDSRRKVCDSEIITNELASAAYFCGHLDNGRGL
ncbi:MAG: transposase [Ferruginibacter sp.]|nr:transposase [Ferruginibacter sp.]